MIKDKHYNTAGNTAIGDEIYGLPHPIAISITGLWIWEWPKLSVNFFIGVA